MRLGRYLITFLLSVPLLITGLAYAGDSPRTTTTVQGPPPSPFGPAGDDHTTSLGSFKIKIVNKFVPDVNSCPNYDATNNILSSPTLYDPGTIIGRSDVSLAGHDIANTPFEVGAVNVGLTGTVINKDRLLPPPTYPCFTDAPNTAPSPPDHGPCASGVGTRKVDTEIRSLKMSNLPGASGPAVTVRAGLHYSEDPFQPTPYADIMTSPGKVQSRSGPSNDPTKDFPATSFFNVYVKVDIPPGYCGMNPGITLYNQDPLKVVNKMLTQFPPRVVYLHDASSIVPILFLTDSPPGVPVPWHRGEVLGYFLLAGHGVGFGSSQSDINEFQNFMAGQSNASCPIQ
jgi:hypothetical protein